MNNFLLFPMQVDGNGGSLSAGLRTSCQLRQPLAASCIHFQDTPLPTMLFPSPVLLPAMRLLAHEHELHQPSVWIYHSSLTCILKGRCYGYHHVTVFILQTEIGRRREAKPFVQSPRSTRPRILDLNPGIPATGPVLVTIPCTTSL